jgi:hypothetical protein
MEGVEKEVGDSEGFDDEIYTTRITIESIGSFLQRGNKSQVFVVANLQA